MRPVELDDLFRFNLAGDPQISPDGSKVVFTSKRADQEKNKYFTRLYVASAGASQARPFTGDEHSDGAPRWSPDGTQIAFVSDRDKPGAQLYLIPPDGGEARKLTNLPEGGIQSPVWSPDGTRLAFLYRKTPEQYRDEAKKEREEKGLSKPVRIHSKLFYRLDGFGYFDDEYWQVGVADAVSGEVKILTNESHHLNSPTWSPDGARIAFVANRREYDDLESNYDDIWTVPSSGGEVERVNAPDGPKEGLTWSPDGRWIAYAGHLDVDDTWGGLNTRILVIPSSGSSDARDLTGSSDREVGYSTLSDSHDVGAGQTIQWSPDSRTLYFPMSERGDTRLYRVGLDGSGLTALTPAGHEMGGFSISRDGTRIGVVIGNATDLYEAQIWAASDGGFDLLQSWGINDGLLKDLAFQMPESFNAPNSDGGTVHGWLLRPTGFDPARKYPAVVYVHGGPAAQYGGQASPFHELQWLAANGYVILFANPRGSKGYGEAHTSAIKGAWGDKDWQDIQAVADFGAGLPYVDSASMAIMGGSYGGYMTAWAIGHTNRFKCAIADRLVANRHSFSGTCDFAFSHGKYWKGNAWDDPSDLWAASPLASAGKIETPLLLIHSDGDLRCPVTQAEELFAALRMQRKVVEFVRYPAESSHGLSRNGPPDLRVDRLKRNLAWLDRWLKS
jgi:dipeptidyl aminopeptidase/acylaminoacyl peptidase